MTLRYHVSTAPAGVIPALDNVVTTQTGASGTVQVDSAAYVSGAGVGPGIGHQLRTLSTGHLDPDTAGQTLLTDAGEGVTVLQLGVDDAESVVSVPLTGVHHPP